MRDEVVAIDLETTGLDPMTDEIIEIGAVRMREGQITDEFSTLVNPSSPIPPNVTYITGIHPADVANAPAINAVLPKISAFAGSAPIIAHSLALDMGFMQRRYGLLKGNTRIDTYDLASVILPNAPRYNLMSLAQHAGIELAGAHRALNDARAAALLYWWLWQRVLALPHSTLQEISTAARNLDWDAAAVFTAALRESTTSVREQAVLNGSSLFQPMAEAPLALGESSPRPFIDVEQAADMVRPEGILAPMLPDYEFRQQQVDMVEAVAHAFNNSEHLIVEAGTGSGKSIAYLLPAVLWATQNHERVIIATNTLHMQDQLLQKDIPLLRAALGRDFRAAVLKGRANYLCPRRLAAARRRPPTTAVEVRTLAKILVWLLDSQTGDRGEINLRGPVENTVWQRLSAQDEGCTLRRCETSMAGACPFYKARKAADSAHIVIANHALLVTDAMTDHQVLPDYHRLIVDEAHQLEEATTHGLTFHIDQAALFRRLADLGNTQRGLLGELLKVLQGHTGETERKRLETFVQAVGETTTLMEVHVRRYFDSIRGLVTEDGAARSDYLTVTKVDRATRSKTLFSRIQSDWATLDEFFEVLSGALIRLNSGLQRMNIQGVADLDDLVHSIDTAARYLNETRATLTQFSRDPDPNVIYWVSVASGDESPTIHGAPLHIGGLMQKYLWQAKESVVLTSATLRTHDSFEFLQERLHAESVTTLEVGSPFNYRDSTLLYLPDDIPDPSDRPNYQRAVERGIIELAAELGGRVLVLFTSYSQLRQTAQAIAPRLALGDITVFDQSEGASRQALIDIFKNNKAVLMGTKSFWEGIDIPGESLSAVIITRLPFAVPTDPIYSTRSDNYTDSFNDYALPDAILRFRQGFGRLIRSRSDRGVVSIFDSRIISKRYGAQFLEALPDCTTRRGPLDSLPEAARQWIQRP